MKNLLIIDLESTCFEDKQKPRNFKSEIIEIGAVLLDTSTLTVIDEYQCFIKPVLFPKLSDFCKQLTTITQEDVDNGILIQKAITEIRNFQQKYNAVFCSWGFYDKKQFQNVCNQFRLPYPFDKRHISIKHEHGNYYNERPMGMERALKFHNIKLNGTHHRGIDDARNISKIAVKMIQEGWKHNNLI